MSRESVRKDVESIVSSKIKTSLMIDLLSKIWQPILNRKSRRLGDMVIASSQEATGLRCPYCKRAMEKFWENSKFWNCVNCNSVFDERAFANKI